eukprot:CAMPEP_0113648380 /NCGR_PEP_ID=MMETSP0017_2-20120614/25658_1 /TAXON_ID=2856 /ORGANISM="Cylindrotheca closterium" /LENGTH=303 /DNA_ID=CAMNT_0000560589 /DNA_START=103 /DNA_END=1014 /DNA_ORIENTATION=- /assembly_acc=CAM_ASM_000147
MNGSIGSEAIPVVSSAGVEQNGRLLQCKLATNDMSLQAHLGNANAYQIGSALLNATPSAVISQHLRPYGGGNGLQYLSPSLGLVARALGLVPQRPSVTPTATSFQALHDYYWGSRLLLAQRIYGHGKPSSGPSPVTKEQVKADVHTEQSALSTTVYSDRDKQVLSECQCLVRQQLEFFESSKEDIRWSTQGRKMSIARGQVGIRCKWCSHLSPQCRSPGAVYYSATTHGFYQAAQNMLKNHLCKECRHIPPDIERRLNRLRDHKRRGPVGKKYWAEAARARGIYECGGRLRFKQSDEKEQGTP